MIALHHDRLSTFWSRKCLTGWKWSGQAWSRSGVQNFGADQGSRPEPSSVSGGPGHSKHVVFWTWAVCLIPTTLEEQSEGLGSLNNHLFSSHKKLWISASASVKFLLLHRIPQHRNWHEKNKCASFLKHQIQVQFASLFIVRRVLAQSVGHQQTHRCLNPGNSVSSAPPHADN